MIERAFLGWDQPLLRRAAAYCVDRFSGDGVLDLRYSSVVMPGARAGRRFKEILLAETASRRLRLVPPRILTPGQLPELFYRPPRPIASDVAMRQAWSLSLRAAPAHVIRTALGKPPSPEDLLGWARFAVDASRLHREVLGSGFDLADIARLFAEGEMPHDDSERWSALATLRQGYLDTLHRAGLSDRDVARLQARSLTNVAADGPVILVGVTDLPNVAADLLRASTTRVTALVHAPEAEEDAFDDAGRVLPAAWADREIRVRPEQVHVVDRPTAQAAAVLRAVSQLGRVRMDDVIVAAADEDLVPYIRDWFAAADVPTHAAAGRPLRLSGPYRLLQAVTEYLERRGWEDFAALARHPDLEERLARGNGRKPRIWAIDEYFRDHLPFRVDQALPDGRWDDAEDLRRRLNRMLEPLSGTQELTVWASRIMEFLISLYGDTRVNGADPDVAQGIDALERIRNAASRLYRLPSALSEPVTAPVAIRALLDEVRSEAQPEESDDDALELVGWLEMALDDAPHAIVAGVNEGFLPESRNSDRFLPDGLRRRIGLQDNSRRYARDAFLLTAQTHCRRSLTLVAGRMTADGDPLRPSRLLLTQSGTELARRVLAFAEQPSPRTEPPLVRDAGRRSGFSLPPQRTLEFDPPQEISVTAFSEVIRDPYRWVLERVLKVEARDDLRRELDAGGFGGIAHRVLAGFARSAAIDETDPVAIRRDLDLRLDESWSSTFGEHAFPAVMIQKEFLRLRLHAFAEWQAPWRSAGWRPVIIEGIPLDADANEEEATLTAEFQVDGEPIRLRGRIDRVDWNAELGELAVLDYKTSDLHQAPDKTHRNFRGVWTDLQLPLYLHLLAGLQRQGVVPTTLTTPRLGYLVMSRTTDRIGVEWATWSEEDLETADEAAREIVRGLRTGKVEFDEDSSFSWPNDPLAPLLGKRQLLGEDDDDEEDVA